MERLLSDLEFGPSPPPDTDTEMLDRLLCETFEFFRREANPTNGLLPDKTQPDSPASLASLGMGLSVYVVAAERQLLSRAEAVTRVLTQLKFMTASHQGPEINATGYKGFYYHFIDMQTGQRAWKCELSTIDTAIFIAGALTAATYFTREDAEETEIRSLAETLYRRVDWKWALNGGVTISHGWTPEAGFLAYRWDTDYSEALLLYILALGSPTFPIESAGYMEWTSTFQWKSIYGFDYLYAGPLFIHQMSHIWLDFRGIYDDFNRRRGLDYFENSRRATYVQRQYGIENPLKFAHYHKYGWGLTASDGPGPAVLMVNGTKREFFDYTARGAPFGPDDGTISPWAVVASLPFAPEIVIETIRHAIERLSLKVRSHYGFDASFNSTYPDTSRNKNGWVSPWIFGLNQGPIILMIENFHSELIWKCVRACPHVITGLRKAGFRDGWLDAKPS